MSFIGTDHMPAPKLKEARLSKAELCVAYEQVVEVRKCSLFVFLVDSEVLSLWTEVVYTFMKALSWVNSRQT